MLSYLYLYFCCKFGIHAAVKGLVFFFFSCFRHLWVPVFVLYIKLVSVICINCVCVIYILQCLVTPFAGASVFVSIAVSCEGHYLFSFAMFMLCTKIIICMFTILAQIRMRKFD